jgi:hypothetical protein
MDTSWLRASSAASHLFKASTHNESLGGSASGFTRPLADIGLEQVAVPAIVGLGTSKQSVTSSAVIGFFFVSIFLSLF